MEVQGGEETGQGLHMERRGEARNIAPPLTPGLPVSSYLRFTLNNLSLPSFNCDLQRQELPQPDKHGAGKESKNLNQGVCETIRPSRLHP